MKAYQPFLILVVQVGPAVFVVHEAEGAVWVQEPDGQLCEDGPRLREEDGTTEPLGTFVENVAVVDQESDGPLVELTTLEGIDCVPVQVLEGKSVDAVEKKDELSKLLDVND